MSPAQYWWKLVGVPAIWIAIGFVLLTIVACSMVNGGLYYPNYGSRRAPAGMQKIKTPDGAEIAVLYLPNPKAHYTIWFFHGNAEDLGDMESFLIELRDRG